MDSERFESLIEIYGAEPMRWPQAEREAARAFLAASEATARLAEAKALDAVLDGWTLAAPSGALYERILARAPTPRRRAVWRVPALWWSSAGLAAACAAGLIIGADIDRAGGLTGGGSHRDTDGAAAAIDGLSAFGGGSDAEQIG